MVKSDLARLKMTDSASTLTSAGDAVVQIFDGPAYPLRLIHWELPYHLAPGEVLVEIELATICGSDILTVSGQRAGPTPAILGHEGVGRIIALGAQRPSLALGDRVVWTISDNCGTSPTSPPECEPLFKYGHSDIYDGHGLNGTYASHIILRPGTHIVPVPDHIPSPVVAPANSALATMVHVISRLPEKMNTVVIQGSGLLGIYSCALLKARGVENVFCVDIDPHRLTQVKNFGGIPIDGRPGFYDQTRQLIVDTAPKGVDAVLEVSGSAWVVAEGIKLLRTGGHYGLVHPDSQINITAEQIIRKSLTLYGIHNYAPQHLDQAIAFLADTVEQYPYGELMSSPFHLSSLSQALMIAQSRQWYRVVVKP